MLTRKLGNSGVEVSALGLGCWAIGGPFWRDDAPVGWGDVDDEESIRAIHAGLDTGITFFDTADVYGAGHSERIVGQALKGIRERVVIATKFGNVFDEDTRRITGADASPEYIRSACDASLQRLGIDRIDLYQFHLADYDPAKAPEVVDALEELVSAGKVRFYGWSTDDPERAKVFGRGEHCVSVQHRLNMFERNDAMLALCEERNLASINRGPLGMGLLTGKFSAETSLPKNDLRHNWRFGEGDLARELAKLDEVREVLTQDGHTLAQAALAWIWARSLVTIPIPGFKTVAQVQENAGALEHGPLTAEQMRRIELLLTGEPMR